MLEGLFQPLHLILILAVALIVFGPGKLPELGEALGKSIRELRKAMSEASRPPEPPTEIADRAESRCGECGTANPAGNRFCGSCGREIAAPAAHAS